MRHCYILMLVITFACSNQVNKQPLQYRWTKILDSGAWKKSYNFQLFSLKDSCMVFHPDGIWISKEGRIWTKSTKKIFMTGGKYGGTPDAPDFRYSNDLWTLEKIP